jgi:primosomal protein N''
MNNIIYIKKDPILVELDDSVDKKSAKRMIAFKYFNNNENLLNEYLDKTNSNKTDLISKKSAEPKVQLEFSF